jgi:hypothetical protein
MNSRRNQWMFVNKDKKKRMPSMLTLRMNTEATTIFHHLLCCLVLKLLLEKDGS